MIPLSASDSCRSYKFRLILLSKRSLGFLFEFLSISQKLIGFRPNQWVWSKLIGDLKCVRFRLWPARPNIWSSRKEYAKYPSCRRPKPCTISNEIFPGSRWPKNVAFHSFNTRTGDCAEQYVPAAIFFVSVQLFFAYYSLQKSVEHYYCHQTVI